MNRGVPLTLEQEAALLAIQWRMYSDNKGRASVVMGELLERVMGTEKFEKMMAAAEKYDWAAHYDDEDAYHTYLRDTGGLSDTSEELARIDEVRNEDRAERQRLMTENNELWGKVKDRNVFLTPQYSGEWSQYFWAKINTLPEDAYLLGCVLQEFEESILGRIRLIETNAKSRHEALFTRTWDRRALDEGLAVIRRRRRALKAISALDKEDET